MQKGNLAKIFSGLLITLILILCGTYAEAATNRFSVIGFRPTYDRSPFFGVRQSQNLEAPGFHFGTALDYSSQPLKANIGATQRDLIKTLVVQHFYATFGIVDWLELSTGLPLVWYNNFTNPDTLGAATTHQDLGDLQLEFKVRILDAEYNPIGIAIAPFITIPTGDNSEFVGNGGVTGGGRLIIDALIDRYTLALNIGALGREEFNAYNLKIGSQFLLGVGAAAKIIWGMSVSGEVESTTIFSDFFSKEDSTSVELRGGIKWDVGQSGFTLGLSGGGGIIHGAGWPRYRVLGTIAYTLSPSK